MTRASAVILCIALGQAAPAAALSDHGFDQASSIGRDILVVAALGIPAVQGDWHGDAQAGLSMGAAFLISTGLKEAFPERRPDGSDRKSFPSGHASVSFAAAATLQNRYGWKVGLPAQLLATFVGVSRVEARKHHWYDVAAGAAIGEASGFLLTSKRDSRVNLVPWASLHEGGVSLAMRF